MKTINKKLSIIGFVLLLFAIIPSFIALTKPGFFPTHDYIYIARVYSMREALYDGQFPVRWVDAFRYGDPLYNFYAPLVYYVGAALKTFLPSYLVTVKVLFGLGFILSFFSMFLFVKEILGKKAAIISSLLYLYAPYRSVDVYVRGALSESWSFIFFPLIFLFSYKISKERESINIVFLALSIAGLFLTHNIMALLFTPFFVLWFIYLIYEKKNINTLFGLTLASVISFLLSSSYLLPALLEKKYIQAQFVTGGYFDFRAHFVAIYQFFKLFWGYGASLWGVDDDMSLQLGVVHWIFIGFAILIIFVAKKFDVRKTIKKNKLFILLMFLFLITLFMQHNRSTFLWLNLPYLSYTQFPWRFMGLSVFFASMLAGFVAKINKISLPATFLVLILVIIAYVPFFKPESYYLDSVDNHYISKEVLKKDDKVPKDYLPKWVERTREYSYDFLPYSDSTEVSVQNFHKKSNKITFRINIEKSSEIIIPLYYYPGWKVYDNKEKKEINEPRGEGLVSFDLEKGFHDIQMIFEDTPIRKISNLLSIVGAATVILIICKKNFLNF